MEKLGGFRQKVSRKYDQNPLLKNKKALILMNWGLFSILMELSLRKLYVEKQFDVVSNDYSARFCYHTPG